MKGQLDRRVSALEQAAVPKEQPQWVWQDDPAEPVDTLRRRLGLDPVQPIVIVGWAA